MNSRLAPLKFAIPLLFVATLVTSCGSGKPLTTPAPALLTRDDTGYFCGMIVEDHAGPKSQVFVRGREQALWFTTARDGLAFLRLPEETRPVTAFYVSTIDRGGWEHPEVEADNWIAAEAAWFVIDSSRLGSMGAPETIPFSNRASAEVFADEFGGRVLQLADIPDNYILGHGQKNGDVHAGHRM
jgi:copper chaperone NosL